MGIDLYKKREIVFLTNVCRGCMLFADCNEVEWFSEGHVFSGFRYLWFSYIWILCYLWFSVNLSCIIVHVRAVSSFLSCLVFRGPHFFLWPHLMRSTIVGLTSVVATQLHWSLTYYVWEIIYKHFNIQKKIFYACSIQRANTMYIKITLVNFILQEYSNLEVGANSSG
jgi:hypothetical protein